MHTGLYSILIDVCPYAFLLIQVERLVSLLRFSGLVITVELS